MDDYSERDELFPPKNYSTKNTPKPRILTITGMHREDFKDQDTGAIRSKPVLEFAETSAVWPLSATAYDRLCEQLNESRVAVWAAKRVRIKLFTSRGLIHVDNKPVDMLIADALDNEEWEALQAKKKDGGNGGGSPPDDDINNSVPF